MMSVLRSLFPLVMCTSCMTAEQGKVTMWSSTNDALIGGMCEYANPPVNSVTDLVLASHLRSGFHCAIGSANPNFGIGEHCGKCYRLTSLNNDGQFGTPGSAGSAVVMISNKIAEGGTSHFDCNLPGFKAITGAESGVFDMEFEETVCDDITGTPTIINWADQNEHYCKMMFENLGGWGSLSSVKACLTKSDGSGLACNDMQRFQGQTWTGCPSGAGTAMHFELTQLSPTSEATTIECSCSGAWPWPTGQRCTCPSNFVAASTTASGTTEVPVTTTEAPGTTEVPATTEVPVATTEAPGTTEVPVTTTELPVTTPAPTSTPVPSCTYNAHSDTAVKNQGTGGNKLKRNSYSSDEAYLDACKAECNGDSSCAGFVDDPTNLLRGRMCKPKTASAGYTKLRKTFYVKGSGC